MLWVAFHPAHIRRQEHLQSIKLLANRWNPPSSSCRKLTLGGYDGSHNSREERPFLAESENSAIRVIDLCP